MNKLQRIIDVTIEVRNGSFHALAHTLNVTAEAENMEKLTRSLLEALSDYYKEKGLLREVTVNEDYGTHKEELQERIIRVIEGR